MPLFKEHLSAIFLFANNNPEQIIGCISFSDIKKVCSPAQLDIKLTKTIKIVGYGRRMLTMALKL